MKKITTLFLILSATCVMAQTNTATPNANFENWTHNSSGNYDDANGWNDLNSVTSTFGAITCYKDSTPADVKSGKYAVHLVTQSVFGQKAPGALTTGTVNTTNETISGGIAYTLRPDSITGFFKYTSVSADNGDVEFYLFDSSSDTVAEAFFRTPTSTVGTYTRISLPLTYKSSNAAATALWILSSSSSQTSAQVGSQLYVDSLGLVFNTTSVKNVTNSTELTVGPNPTRNTISITNMSQSMMFSLYDITGRKIATQTAIAGTNLIDVTSIPTGLYIYSITDSQDKSIKTGKIIVQK